MPMGVKSVTDVNGGTCVVPVTFGAIGAVHSTDALKAVDGTVPATWTGLLDLCDKARDHGKVLFALGNPTAWVTQLVSCALVATTVYAAHPDFDEETDSGKETFASSG